MKILVATDGSEFGDEAVRVAAERPWPPDSELRVINVMEHLPIAVAGGRYTLSLSELLAKMQSVATEIATRAANYLRKSGLKVTQNVREGAAAVEILNEAEEWGADLILVGTHGKHGLTKFLLGSVAERVATHAHCSVEIARR
jgi:nucleotide-binding universal stress UspA family protein